MFYRLAPATSFFDSARHVPVDDVISCLAARSASRDRVGVNGYGHSSVALLPTKSPSRGRGERPQRAGTATTHHKCAGDGRLCSQTVIRSILTSRPYVTQKRTDCGYIGFCDSTIRQPGFDPPCRTCSVPNRFLPLARPRSRRYKSAWMGCD